MNSKLLAIREGKNVLLYSVTYNFDGIKEYIRQIDEKYSYTKTDVIETTIFDNIVLSMGKYDSKRDECRVRKNYKIIKDIEVINENEKRSIIEIEVEYYSQIAKALKEAFLDNMPLLNTTKLIMLMKSIYGFDNNFSYNSLIDNKDLSWDDPRRLTDAKLNLAKIDRVLNSKRVKFNDLEETDILDTIFMVVEALKSYITIEQVGIFPIEENMADINELLAAFAVRNEDCELFFGSLENVEMNFNSAELINIKRYEIIKSYNLNGNALEPQKQKNRIDVFNKFLQF